MRPTPRVERARAIAKRSARAWPSSTAPRGTHSAVAMPSSATSTARRGVDRRHDRHRRHPGPGVGAVQRGGGPAHPGLRRPRRAVGAGYRAHQARRSRRSSSRTRPLPADSACRPHHGAHGRHAGSGRRSGASTTRNRSRPCSSRRGVPTGQCKSSRQAPRGHGQAVAKRLRARASFPRSSTAAPRTSRSPSIPSGAPDDRRSGRHPQPSPSDGRRGRRRLAISARCSSIRSARTSCTSTCRRSPPTSRSPSVGVHPVGEAVGVRDTKGT